VTATDFVPELLRTAARRAETEGLELETREADAQALPFADGAFDLVLSTFSVMFAPDPPRASAELLRICGPAPHRPDRVDAGQRHGRHPGHRGAVRAVPAGPRRAQPDRMGTKARVRELLGPGVTELTAEVLSTDMCGISPAQRVEFNRTYVGPAKAVFGGLDPDAQRALAAELAGCLQRVQPRHRRHPGRPGRVPPGSRRAGVISAPLPSQGPPESRMSVPGHVSGILLRRIVMRISGI
jgi:hypothetical protein